MPINSFADYPMSWKPNKNLLYSPKYRSLAEQLTKDILSGSLPPHTKLPPQRELADFLDVNLSTVTRAFQLCTRQGLLYGITGRGTYVSPNASASISLVDKKENNSYIEMGIIKPLDSLNHYTLSAIKTVLARNDLSLLDYSYPTGTPYQKAAAQKWLATFHIDAPLTQISITSGAQTALTVILVSLFQAGDKIITDHYTYSNFIELANMLQIRLIPVAGDAHGILPDALEAQCRLQHPQGIYLVPNFHNPTGTTMDIDRKKSLAKFIQKYQLTVIEDDIYAFLHETPVLPMAYFVPEQTCYICSLSKSLCSGLRVAYLTYPEKFAQNIHRGIFNIHVKAPSINSEAAGELIFSGIAHTIVAQKRKEASLRANIFLRYFPEIAPDTIGFSAWLPLPEAYYEKDFEKLARQKNIQVYHSKRFLVGEADSRQFLRIALSSPDSVQELEQGLSALYQILRT